MMISCDVCDKWQHGSCFGIISETFVPELHICEVCANDKKVNLIKDSS